MKYLTPLFDAERFSLVAGFALALGLLTAGIGLAVYDNSLYREQALREITLQSQILAASEAASLDFDDRATAQEYLDAFRINPQIDRAAIYDRNNVVVAQFMRPDSTLATPSTPPPPGYRVDGDYLTVTTPVLQGSRRIGTVYVRAGTEPVTRRLPRYGAVILLLSMASLVVIVLVKARTRLSAANQRLLVEMEERGKAEEALRQSQKMEAVGLLTGGIAHDFNNMLAVIIGSLSILTRRIAQGKTDVAQYVDSAMDGARRAATLTQQLLAFSRRQPLAPVAIDVTSLVLGMSEMMSRILGEQVNLEAITSPGTWRIFADRAQLETAILNLAVNARDAMPQGGTLSIRTSNCRLEAADVAGPEPVAPGDYLAIAVRDTGTGMPPDVVGKVFEPFFTTKSVGKGTGLGLSQVYGFMKQSNGHVRIESEPGKGTSVILYFPRFVGAPQTAAPAQDAASLPAGKREEIILVVEDETQVRRTTVDSLRELGYTVRHAEGVATALRTLETQPDIQLLFTDIVMPDGNGKTLADTAKRRRPGLKILYTTGYTKEAIVRDGVLDQGIQVLMKPYSFEQLAAKVREALRS